MSNEGVVKQERAATGQVLRCSDKFSSKKFKPSIVALYVFMTDKWCVRQYLLTCSFEWDTGTFYCEEFGAFINSPPISKNIFVVFLDHQAKNSNANIAQTVLHCIRKPWWNSYATQKGFAVKKNLIRWFYDVAWKEWHNNTWYSSLFYPSDPSMRCKTCVNYA